MKAKLGNIAPGYYTDITAPAADPLVDIDVVIGKVRWVIKGGQSLLPYLRTRNSLRKLSS